MKRWTRRFVGLIGLFVLLFFLLHTAPGKELSRSVFVNTVLPHYRIVTPRWDTSIIVFGVERSRFPI